MIGLTHRGIALRTMPFLFIRLFGCFRVIDNVGCDDTRRHGDDGVTKQHNECREQPADGCYWRNVAITHRRHCHDGPIDGCAQIGEGCPWSAGLNHEHQRAQTSDQDQYEQEIDGDLGETPPERTQQEVAFVDIVEQFEDAEDAYETERSEQDHIPCVGEEIGEIRRHDGQQVDDAEEAQANSRHALYILR